MTSGKNGAVSKMTHIRPRQLLSMPDKLGEEIKFFMPPAYGGSLTTIESTMLVKLLKIVDPAYIFEFGTYTGNTTRLLLENMSVDSASDERVYTLDLPSLDNVHFQASDKSLAEKAINFERTYQTSKKKAMVKQLLQDSMTLDAKLYEKKFQYIFIDANHEVSYVRNDTENALKMICGLPGCIVWHDYGNPQFPELTHYLDELSLAMPLHHIEETMLVFSLTGKDVPPR